MTCSKKSLLVSFALYFVNMLAKIDVDLTYSSSLPLEHRAFTTRFQRTLSWAVFLVCPHVSHIPSSYPCNSLGEEKVLQISSLSGLSGPLHTLSPWSFPLIIRCCLYSVGFCSNVRILTSLCSVPVTQHCKGPFFFA